MVRCLGALKIRIVTFLISFNVSTFTYKNEIGLFREISPLQPYLKPQLAFKFISDVESPDLQYLSCVGSSHAAFPVVWKRGVINTNLFQFPFY